MGFIRNLVTVAANYNKRIDILTAQMQFDVPGVAITREGSNMVIRRMDDSGHLYSASVPFDSNDQILVRDLCTALNQVGAKP